MRRATSAIIHQSGRASPGGARKARCREMQRSELVTVPSFSPHAAAGRTMSAKHVVSVGQQSLTTTNGHAPSAARTRPARGMLTAGLVLRIHSALTVPSSTASNSSTALSPGRVAMRGADQNRRTRSTSRRIVKAHMRGELIGKAANLPPAHRVRLTGQRERAHAGTADAPGRKMAVDDRVDLVRSGRGLVGALRIECQRALGRGEQVVEADQIAYRHVGNLRDIRGRRGVFAGNLGCLGKTGRAFACPCLVAAPVRDKMNKEAAEHRHIGSWPDGQMNIGDVACRGMARIDGNDFRAPLLARSDEPLIKHRMAPRRVAADQNDEIGGLDIVVATRNDILAKGADMPSY